MRRALAFALAVAVCLLALPQVTFAGETTARTSLASASDARRHNALLAAEAINGTVLECGGTFSFNDTVGARTAERGFLDALNGRGVTVTGGGVAQVATTLYLALIGRDDIEYRSIRTYNELFTGDYVSSGYDAVLVDYNNGIDFSFTSWSEEALKIRAYADGDELVCEVDAESAGARRLISSVAFTLPSDDAEYNARLAARKVFGASLASGEIFSFNGAVGEVSLSAGFRNASAGTDVSVLGGGVARVADIIYLAARSLEDVRIVERHATAQDMTDVSYALNQDFTFIYTGGGRITIETYADGDRLVCDVYQMTE